MLDETSSTLVKEVGLAALTRLQLFILQLDALKINGSSLVSPLCSMLQTELLGVIVIWPVQTR